jgi:cytochrome c oxidase subunit 3/cytochrome o ubiquinol oxidase subunit 3
MRIAAATVTDADVPWILPERGPVAMCFLIAAESAIFTIFVVAYLFYVGKSLTGPLPHDVLHAPIFLSICLLGSSATIHLATRALRAARVQSFVSWWTLTIALGGVFLAGTAREWHHLIYEAGLTIRTNLFGTTYYSLVGLHAFHVTVGLIALSTVLVFALSGQVRTEHGKRVDVLSLYWHFVDVVWIVVFTVVYVIGR